MNAFKPEGATIKAVAAAAATTAAKLTDNPDAVLITNTGTATVFIKFGDSTVAATVNDFPCPAGVVQCITPSPRPSPLYVSIIALGATGDCYFTPGSGL